MGRQHPGKGSCPAPPAGEGQVWAGSRQEGAAPGRRADGTRGQGKASWLFAQGKMVLQEPSLAVGSHPTSMVSFLSKMPLPFYSFFRRLALELPCLSLLELGRPLAWCSGTSWSISGVEVRAWVVTHRWAAVCGGRTPLSDPSVCKITARTDTTLCLSFLGISSQVEELREV